MIVLVCDGCGASSAEGAEVGSANPMIAAARVPIPGPGEWCSDCAARAGPALVAVERQVAEAREAMRAGVLVDVKAGVPVRAAVMTISEDIRRETQ